MLERFVSDTIFLDDSDVTEVATDCNDSISDDCNNLVSDDIVVRDQNKRIVTIL